MSGHTGSLAPETGIAPVQGISNESHGPTALYRYYDDEDVLLYVGITAYQASRERGHVRQSPWMERTVRSTIMRYPTRARALAEETKAIHAEHPVFNLAENDHIAARGRRAQYERAHPRVFAKHKIQTAITLRSTHPLRTVLRDLLTEGEAFGHEIAGRTGIPSGSVQPILRRLDEARWVECRWEDMTVAEAHRRRPRRYYQLTPAGRKAALEVKAHHEAHQARGGAL